MVINILDIIYIKKTNTYIGVHVVREPLCIGKSGNNFFYVEFYRDYFCTEVKISKQ